MSNSLQVGQAVTLRLPTNQLITGEARPIVARNTDKAILLVKRPAPNQPSIECWLPLGWLDRGFSAVHGEIWIVDPVVLRGERTRKFFSRLVQIQAAYDAHGAGSPQSAHP